MEGIRFLTCKKCKDAKPIFLANCCCFFCEKCFHKIAELGKSVNSQTIKCDICSKILNLTTAVDLRDSNKLNLLFFPEKNFTTINNLFSNLSFCIQFFKEEARLLTQRLEEKDQAIATNASVKTAELEESLRSVQAALSKSTSENNQLREFVSSLERKSEELAKVSQDFEVKARNLTLENKKLLEKSSKAEDKLSKALEKLKKYKEELTTADEEYKEAQTYIKKQREQKEQLEAQVREYEAMLKNGNVNNRQIRNTVRPSEFSKNQKPTMNKNEAYIAGNRVASKEAFGAAELTNKQKEYIRNIYDEKFKEKRENNENANNLNLKKRRIEGENANNPTNNNADKAGAKSFGFKQFKFM